MVGYRKPFPGDELRLLGPATHIAPVSPALPHRSARRNYPFAVHYEGKSSDSHNFFCVRRSHSSTIRPPLWTEPFKAI